jgi:hypothetical protein
MTILLLAVSTGIFYFILIQQAAAVEHAYASNHDNLARFIAYSTFILVILLNKFVLTVIIQKICVFQKYSTKSKEQFSFTLKYSISTFFTTAIMTLLV